MAVVNFCSPDRKINTPQAQWRRISPVLTTIIINWFMCSRFDVFTAVMIQCVVFCVVTP